MEYVLSHPSREPPALASRVQRSSSQTPPDLAPRFLEDPERARAALAEVATRVDEVRAFTQAHRPEEDIAHFWRRLGAFQNTMKLSRKHTRCRQLQRFLIVAYRQDLSNAI